MAAAEPTHGVRVGDPERSEALRHQPPRAFLVVAALAGLLLFATAKAYSSEETSVVSEVKVLPSLACPGRISPLQYGQFVEYLCDLVPSMWAEKLYDGSFEGPLPYAFEFRKATDFREKPWYPIGAVHRGEFTLDGADPYNGKVSQRVASAGAPCTLGIAQDGLYLRKGEACRLSVYLRAQGFQGPVTVALRDGQRVLARASLPPTPAWKKHVVELKPTATTSSGSLSLEFQGPGILWIDQISLMPTDSVGGWRRDVVKALRALRPGVIRFGGSAIETTYEWRTLIGDPDKRVPWANEYWGGRHPAAAGLEELLGLCQAVGAELMMCVRVTGKTPEEGAAEVQYFNGPPDSPMGKLRAANGHPKPYGIRLWQVGNELGGEEYAKQLKAFCAAMKAEDPSIKLLSAFPDEAVMREAGQYLDYLCPHHYGCEDLPAMEADFNRIRELIAKQGAGRTQKVAVTEWNTTAGSWGLQRAMLWTLDNALACSRYHNLLHRQADLVEITNRSNLANSFCSGIIQTDNHSLYMTPTYYAQQLYSTRSGVWPLSTEIRGQLQPLDVSATLSASGDLLSLFLVNGSSDALPCRVDLSGLGATAQDARLTVLEDTQHAGERDISNSFWEPTRVSPVATKVQVGTRPWTLDLRPLSLTVLEVNVAAKRLVKSWSALSPAATSASG